MCINYFPREVGKWNGLTYCNYFNDERTSFSGWTVVVFYGVIIFCLHIKRSRYFLLSTLFSLYLSVLLYFTVLITSIGTGEGENDPLSCNLNSFHFWFSICAGRTLLIKRNKENSFQSRSRMNTHLYIMAPLKRILQCRYITVLENFKQYYISFKT